jgi:ketosteroid isomerase-like protein
VAEVDGSQLAGILSRLERLESLEEIRVLRMRYHQHINDLEWERVAELYTEDAVVQLDYVAKWEGRARIAEGFSTIPKRTPLVKQFIHAHQVNLDGDNATGSAFVEVRDARGGQSLMIAGKYDDKYVRTNGRWLISHTYFTSYFSVPIQTGWAGPELHYLKSHKVDE